MCFSVIHTACRYLHAGRVEPVVPVNELNDGLLAVSHCAVVLHAEVLERLHQPPRHVPRLCRLNCGVHQSLYSTEHGIYIYMYSSKEISDIGHFSVFRLSSFAWTYEYKHTLLLSPADSSVGALSSRKWHLRKKKNRGLGLGNYKIQECVVPKAQLRAPHSSSTIAGRDTCLHNSRFFFAKEYIAEFSTTTPHSL